METFVESVTEVSCHDQIVIFDQVWKRSVRAFDKVQEMILYVSDRLFRLSTWKECSL